MNFSRFFRYVRSGLMAACLLPLPSLAQEEVVDQVVAVVGGQIILRSDIEKKYQQFQQQGMTSDPQSRCFLFDQMIIEKLLINQAGIDSVTVSDGQVEDELNKRMRYYISQIGSEEKLEEYFHTTIGQLKEELHDIIRDQMTVQTMQSHIAKDISATPADVRSYFESIPPDSIPYMDAELEVGHILKTPSISDAEKQRIRSRLEEFRQKVLDGSDFSVYAALYSDDKSTAKKGGELGYFTRGSMVPEFEGAAFNLKPGEVSPVIETKFGFHIIQMIDRRGEQINVRHILLQPKISDDDLLASYRMLDSLSAAINNGSITFADAALKYSDDKDTRNNGGLLINAENNTTRMSPDKMDRMLFFQVDSMPIGRVSHPILMTTPEGKSMYHIVMVKTRTQPHRANLKDDYQKIQEVVLQEKQGKALNDWVEKTRKKTFIDILSDLGSCKETLQHWTEQQSNIH